MKVSHDSVDDILQNQGTHVIYFAYLTPLLLCTLYFNTLWCIYPRLAYRATFATHHGEFEVSGESLSPWMASSSFVCKPSSMVKNACQNTNAYDDLQTGHVSSDRSESTFAAANARSVRRMRGGHSADGMREELRCIVQ